MARAKTGVEKRKEAEAPGQRIRSLREGRNMSLADLGKLLEMSRSEVFKLELGERILRRNHVEKLCEIFVCKPEDVVADKDELSMVMDRGVARKGNRTQRRTGGGDKSTAPPVRQGVVPLRSFRPGAAPETLPPVPAPPSVAGIRGAYAVYMADLSMDPAIPQGALMFVNPALPVCAGDRCAVRYKDGRLQAALCTLEKDGRILAATVLAPAKGRNAKIDLSADDIEAVEKIVEIRFR